MKPLQRLGAPDKNTMLGSFTGVQMQVFARGLLVYEMTDSSFALGLVTAAWGIPILLLSLIGGAFADRVRKRNLLLITQSATGIISLVIAVLIMTDVIALWQLIVAAFVSGIVFAFNAPSSQAIIPELVGREQLMNAISLNSAAMNLTRVAAPTLAGVLVVVIGGADIFKGVSGVYFIIVGCYALAVALLSMIRGSKKPEPRPTSSVWKDLVEGLRYVRGSPTILALLLLAFVPILFAMPYMVLLPVFALDILDIGPEGLGWLMTASGVGALIGSLIIASISDFKRKGLLLMVLAFLFGITLVAFSTSSSLIPSLALLVGVGIASSGYMAVNNTLVQSNVTDEIRGRVMSVYMMTFGLMPIGALPIGALAEYAGAPLSIGVGGAIVAIFAVAMAVFRPSVRRLE